MKDHAPACRFVTDGCNSCAGSGREGLGPSRSGPQAWTSRLGQASPQASIDKGSSQQQIPEQTSIDESGESQSLQDTLPATLQSSFVATPDKHEVRI